MKYLQVFWGYLVWHYGKAILSSFSLWKNLTVFIFNFFSIKYLLGNFFTPWKRLNESYPKWYEFKEYFSSLILNTLMRIVGMIIRFFTIIIGLFCTIIFIISFPLALFIWIITPLIILFLIVIGIILITF